MSSNFGTYSKMAKGAALGGDDSGFADVLSPAVATSHTFYPQSDFSDSLLEKALALQRPGSAIVESTRKNADLAGYAIGLHPSSQTPVAIKFKGDKKQTGDSGVLVLKPGQVMRPQGAVQGRSAAFTGFEWGLPFGWLGGGTAHLVVFTTPDARVDWAGDPEIIFHRQRMKIYAPASVPTVANSPINWPTRFPWSKGYFEATTAPQQGKPNLVVTPTRILFRIRVVANNAPREIRALMSKTDDYDLDSDGVLSTAASTMDTIVAPLVTAIAGLAQQATHYPVVEVVTGPLLRLSGDDARVVLVNAAADTDLENLYVDVIRYGRL